MRGHKKKSARARFFPPTTTTTTRAQFSELAIMSIAVAEDYDILCGQDKTFAQRPGNVIYHRLIQANAVAYAAAVTRSDRMRITKSIVTQLQTPDPLLLLGRRRRRFLKAAATRVLSPTTDADAAAGGPAPARGGGGGGGGFAELSPVAARDKVSHALRFAARGSIAAAAAAASSAPIAVPGNRGGADGRLLPFRNGITTQHAVVDDDDDFVNEILLLAPRDASRSMGIPNDWPGPLPAVLREGDDVEIDVLSLE